MGCNCLHSSPKPHLVSVRLSASWKPRRLFSPSATIAARNSDGPDSMLNRMTPICKWGCRCNGSPALLPHHKLSMITSQSELERHTLGSKDVPVQRTISVLKSWPQDGNRAATALASPIAMPACAQAHADASVPCALCG